MNAIRALVEGAAGGGAGGRAKATTGGGGGIDLDLLGGSGTQPIRDENVLHPSYVLSQSNAERIAIGQGEEEGSSNIAPNNTLTSTSTSGASLLGAATEHQTTEQSIEASSSSSSEASSSVEVSGIGYWTSSSSGRSFDSTLDGVSETSLDGPPHAPPPGGQTNADGLVLSPISNANASHVHNASMASPGLGGNGVDEDLPALAALSNGPSSDTSGTVGGSQQQEEMEQNASNEYDFPLQEDTDEEEQEGSGEDGGTNLPAEDDQTAEGNSSDASLMEPTPFALETALDRPWTDGKRFPRGAAILSIRLRLSKKLYGKGKRGANACHVYVQTKPCGPYPLIARRQNDCGSFVVDLLRDMGHHRILAAAVESAYRGDARTHEVPGGAKTEEGCALVLNPCVVMTNKDGIRVARRAFCFPDSMHNLLYASGCDIVMAPSYGEEDLGIFLRKSL